jgi:hypothetical protein
MVPGHVSNEYACACTALSQLLAVAAAAGEGGDNDEADRLALQVADLLDLMAGGSAMRRDDDDDDDDEACLAPAECFKE